MVDESNINEKILL